MFFTRLILPPDTGYKTPVDWNGCWKIYTICTAADKRTSTTNEDVKCLNQTDKKAALSSYVSFLNRANTGQVLTELYDEKQCHEAHSFKMNEEIVKIFRIWGTGVIRIYFLYLPKKVILILKTWPKRKDKLSNGEKVQLEGIARQVLECLQTNSFSTRVL
ncbi:MAG: hypothetical protein HY937_02175 [Nitrosomonadales bacterium]|nr:hypothetical protein [Nitrosomonadales bacterium]